MSATNCPPVRYLLMRIPLAPLALIPLLLAPPAAAREPVAATRFDPIVFFAGHTEGTGRLKIALHGARTVAVHGDGRVTGDGTIVLRQTVEEPGKNPKRREWKITQVAPGRYTGTLTDAVGPVTGTTIGGRLKLVFRMRGGLHAVQWIEAAPGGRSARNHMTVTKLGIPVARLDETIRRTGS